MEGSEGDRGRGWGEGKEGVLPCRRTECPLLGWVGIELLIPAILLAYLLQDLVDGGEGGEETVRI